MCGVLLALWVELPRLHDTARRVQEPQADLALMNEFTSL